MILVLVPILVFWLDYKVKAYIEANKKEGQSEKILGGHVTLRRMSNKGAAVSLLEDKPQTVTWISGVILFFMSLGYIRGLFKKGNFAEKLSYVLILGGGLSNFFDRIKKGAVTDYFSFNIKWKWLKRLVFNISDMFIIMGSVFAVFLGARRSK